MRDYDNEDDYRDVKNPEKPAALTLFDLVKTKIDTKDTKGKFMSFKTNLLSYS